MGISNMNGTEFTETPAKHPVSALPRPLLCWSDLMCYRFGSDGFASELKMVKYMVGSR